LSSKAILLVLGPLALAGCALSPMYAGGGQGTIARSLAGVNVTAIEGKSGWLVRAALVDRLGAGADGTPSYRLDVRLDEQLQGLGLLSTDAVTRERRTLRARYQLVDLTSGEIILDATAGADAGIDIVSSEYAVIAAEQTALENLSHEVADQIVTRVATKLRKAG
jgi:LPS-assembly lipoprotein